MMQKNKTFLDDVMTTLSIHAEQEDFVNLSSQSRNELFNVSQKQNINSNVNIPQNFNQQPQNLNTNIPPQIVHANIHPQNNHQQQVGINNQHKPVPNLELSQLDLKSLENYSSQCTRCPLANFRSKVVFGQGNPNADLMFIGEGPGHEEDVQGLPFVGDPGQLLTKMINAMQFKRSEVYLANIVKCRLPDNRTPEDSEATECLHFLNRQIDLIQPKIIVLLGPVPLKYILGTTGISKHRGIWTSYRGIKTLPTFHPAYLLRTPSAKKMVWEDLQKVMQFFGKVHNVVSKR
jgi:DNA polymerase